MGVAVGRKPQSEHPINERGVQEAFVGPVLLSALNRAAVEVDASAEGVHVRLVGHVPYGAGHGTGAKSRALRAVEHFDALDVIEVQIRLHAGPARRCVVDKKSRRRGVCVSGIAAVGYSTHHEKLRARAHADEGNGRHLFGVVVESLNGKIAHVLLRQHVNAQGNILQVLLALARRHDNHLETPIGRAVGLRRQRRCLRHAQSRNGRGDCQTDCGVGTTRARRWCLGKTGYRTIRTTCTHGRSP